MRKANFNPEAKKAAIDVHSSVEASAKVSPELRSFISRHDSIYGQRFGEHIARLRDKL